MLPTASISSSSPHATAAKPGRLRVAAPRQRRRPALVALALLLILVGGVAATTVYLRGTQRNQVLAAARPVAMGHTITGADLAVVSLSVDPRLRPLPAAARGQVAGQVAAVNLVAGTLLLRGMLTSRDRILEPGKGLVGLAFKAGQLPGELAPGDLVEVVRTPTPPGDQPAGEGGGVPAGVLASGTRVLSVSAADDGDTTRVSLIVALDDAGALYRANALGQLALIVLPAA